MRIFTLIVFLSVSVQLLLAQNDTVYNFTLQQAQDFAIDHFFSGQNARLDIEAAQKKIWETTAIGLPQISGGINYTYMPDIPEISFPVTIMGANKQPDDIIYARDFSDPDFYSIQPGETVKMGVENNITYNLSVSQLIFSGEYIVGLQASKAYKSLASENYDKVKMNIRESIAGSYYSILILQKNRKVLSETLDNLKLNYEHTKKFYEQGLIEDTDVDQLDLTVKRTENNLRNIENQIKYLTKLFKYQIGVNAETTVQFSDSIEYLLEKNIINPDNYQFNLDENIDYQLLSTQEKLQNLSLKREKSQFLPSLSGFYQYKDLMNTPDFNTNIKHMFGISMNVPIISSGMRLAKVGQAKIELDKVKIMKEQEAQRLILTAQQSTFNYNTALQNYYNEKQNFTLSKKVFDKATVKFKEGIMSSLDLSLINNQYLQAQLSYATAIQELLTKKVEMDKAYNKLNY